MLTGRLSIIPALGFAALAYSMPVQAQPPSPVAVGRAVPRPSVPAYIDDARSSYYDARRSAYDNGYREGLKEGEKDARKGDRFAYQDERTFQRADKGYHRSFGDAERYRQTFRSGYATGYSDAFQRWAPNYRDERYGTRGYPTGNRRDDGYGRQPDYRSGRQRGYGYGYSPALDNGRNDGYEKGREDARDRDSFDPVRHKWYRAGDRHYRSEYGSKDQYKDLYRRGFQEGYDRGYRESRWR